MFNASVNILYVMYFWGEIWLKPEVRIPLQHLLESLALACPRLATYSQHQQDSYSIYFMCLCTEIAKPLSVVRVNENLQFTSICFEVLLTKRLKLLTNPQGVRETSIITLYKPSLTLQGDMTKALIDFFTVNMV